MKTLVHQLNSALLCFGIVFFFTGCQKAVPVKAVKATLSHVEYTISTTTAGTVEAEQQAILVFGTLGRVQEILVDTGDEVRKGALLARQENQDMRSIFLNAEKDLNRTTRLFKEKLVSRASLDEAKRTHDVARANVDKTEIHAPFDGTIMELNLEIGETSQPQFTPEKPPLRIVDRKPRTIKGNVDEVDLSKIKIGTRARVKVLAVRPKPYPAVVSRIVPFVSTNKEQERTASVELKMLENDEFIPVGASAEIEIIIEAKDRTLALPSRAILGAGSARHVFKVVDNRLHKTAIQVGIGNYDRMEVLSGISEGDLIAQPGDTELTDGMKVQTEQVPWP
ncbi:MAG TPA: hypothetical protein DCS07_07270 [Bdellovibrionales bacterium]|nr:MAG: hypothetical protein A2Z97_09440 [Bdellovibrionales bacterium GWB1_52_6]OFZ03620.1 MAG: hypothetical protein A2X97_00825 [Bdellovibrionales bacterium GWA1_52_35]OFZ34925.1 MAG: hypothetical protein A2070_14395 [Bdellovibrionales bacterium GWC1_52_8]HAR42419.1 hypothetical protein [Bdellovibrionales bacterium]HCM40656.1 hypothetical protein [Bdellovibrionales bacterium]